MISVVIPARNAAATIGVTLSSLVADKVLIGEILLIDDGSEDETVARARDVARAHELPLKVTSVSAGSAGAARNVGLAQAQGDHIFFLDADDEVMPGGVTLLRDALRANPEAGLAVGASVHRASRADKLKLPGPYGGDRQENVRRYLANEVRSITVGSALVAASATAGIRFPERIGLDEDTLYWTAVLTRVLVAAIERPVLVYNLDETRMAQRFLSKPRKVFLDIALELNGLAAFGIDKDTLQQRKAFIAQRIARHLIRRNRYREAAGMMRAGRMQPGFLLGLRSSRYRMSIAAGRAAQSIGYRKPVALPLSAAATPRRVLVLTADPAFPPVSGADLRNYQNARACAGVAEVLLVSVHPSGQSPPPDHRIRTAALLRQDEPRGRSIRSHRTSIETRIPEAALGRLGKLLREFDPDTVLVEGMPLFALIGHLRPLVPRLILDMHNVESDLAAKRRPAGLLARLLPGSRSDEERIRAAERLALKAVDRVWVCSEPDRARILDIFGTDKPIDIVPNGVPRFDAAPRALPPLAGKGDGWPVLLFVGHLGYGPNLAAAKRLAENILPLVRQNFPAARLVLAGRRPQLEAQHLAGVPGVELVADPDDLSELLASSHISVMPLSEGGGTRIKILEAMAWGLPVIATPVAAEGQGFHDGLEIALADTDDGLAQLVVSLSTDGAQMERQRAAAWTAARTRFGPQAIQDAVRSGLGLGAVL
ncbi:MAG TPA: glycosyltransferase [Rhizobiaceae bacterium]